MKNPLFKIQGLFIYIIIWMIMIFAGTYVSVTQYHINFYIALTDSFVTCTILFGLGFSYWYPARYISIDNNLMSKIVIKHFFAAIVSSLFWASISYFILKSLFSSEKEYLEILNSVISWYFVFGILFYELLVTFYYLYIYYVNFHEKLVKEAEFKSLLKEAELKSLKYQINPHFIFNSLNSISSLTMTNPSKAREMTIKLSEYLRSTLANNERQKSCLKDEIKNSRLYLDIEKVRFGERFEYIEEIESGCDSYQVPSMVIQPLLENAIKHGVYESISKIKIKLNCSVKDDYVRLSLENDYEDDIAQTKGEKIGLKNIKERLKLIYNQDNLLTVEKSNNIFKVNLFIPIQEN